MSPRPAAFLHRRHLLAAAAAGALAAGLLPAAAHAEVADLQDAINQAGRERMLSQRTAKSWFALGLDIEHEQAARTLAASIALFERQLADLQAWTSQAAVRGTCQQLDAAWRDYRALLGAPAGAAPAARAAAADVLARASRVLQLAHQGTQQLEALSGRPVGRWGNLSGRQRMLSQRMAALALGAHCGADSGACRTEIGRLRADFVAAHAQLAQAPEATAAIRDGLQLAQVQWTFFDRALAALEASASGPAARDRLRDVFTTSERILESMDAVTGQFARLA